LFFNQGSTVGRTAGNTEKKGTILKDLDIKRKLHLPPNLKGRFLEQLKRDSAVRNLPTTICLPKFGLTKR
jgi:hypothetical protein